MNTKRLTTFFFCTLASNSFLTFFSFALLLGLERGFWRRVDGVFLGSIVIIVIVIQFEIYCTTTSRGGSVYLLRSLSTRCNTFNSFVTNCLFREGIYRKPLPEEFSQFFLLVSRPFVQLSTSVMPNFKPISLIEPRCSGSSHKIVTVWWQVEQSNNGRVTLRIELKQCLLTVIRNSSFVNVYTGQNQHTCTLTSSKNQLYQAGKSSWLLKIVNCPVLGTRRV